MRTRLFFAVLALLFFFADPAGACITILQQPQPAVVRPAEFLWTADPVATNVNAAAPSTIRYQWYEGARGDTSRPFAGASTADFCPPPPAGTRWQCSWGSFNASVAVWARLEADCGSADTDFTTVKVVVQWPEGMEVRVRPTSGWWRVIGIADFDRDTHPDLLLHAPGSPRLVTWRMYEETVLSTEDFLDQMINAPWVPATLADMDNDGDPDLIMQNPESGLVGVWILDGTHVVSTETFIGFASPGWKVRGAGDFDRDGDADLLFVGPHYEDVVWILNGVSVVSTENFLKGTVRVDAVADMNQDAWPDLVDGDGWIRREIRAQLFENLMPDTPLITWPWPRLTTFRLGLAADVDRNGKMDVLACSACEPGPFGTSLSYFLNPALTPEQSPWDARAGASTASF